MEGVVAQKWSCKKIKGGYLFSVWRFPGTVFAMYCTCIALYSSSFWSFLHIDGVESDDVIEDNSLL